MADTILYDSALRLFAAETAPAAAGWPAGLWDAVEEAGYPDALLGGGAGLVEAATILRAAGRHAAPIPLAETMLARLLCAAAGIAPPAGAATLAPVEPGERIARIGDTLAGRATRVPWARDAASLVVVAGNRLHVVMRRHYGLDFGENLAGEPRDELAAVATAEGERGAPLPDGVDAEAVLRLGAVLRAAQIAGAIEGALDLATRYAEDRVQFGRPIGRFQAIQQQMALLAEEAAAALVAVENAAEAVALARPSAAIAVPAAKIRAGIAAGKAAEIAHQVHGAIGFTAEHGLHLLTRRLWSWRDEFGDESFWAQQLGAQIAAAGPDRLWPLLTEP